MAKIKFNKHGEALIVLRGTEIELVHTLLAHVRLGYGDQYKNAALDILEKIDSLGGDPCNECGLDVSVESEAMNFTFSGENTKLEIIFEVRSKHEFE